MASLSGGLSAQFERRFPRGPCVQADLRAAGAGNVTVLFGPSGAGKTTILRCLAGLDRPQSGTIECSGATWFSSRHGICLSPQQRGIGYLFQEYALFPHMTVAGNIGFAVREKSALERSRRTQDLIQLVGLTGLDTRYPRQLSGGQQQRLALARALACQPRLLLLDEPLSALDAPTRQELRYQLREILAGLTIPVVLVTHDPAEALSLGNDVVIVEEGKVAQSGQILEVFAHPATLSVARYLGVENVLPGKVLAVTDGLATVAVGTAQLLASVSQPWTGPCDICIRAEDVIVQVGTSYSSARNQLPGRVIERAREGALHYLTLDCGFRLKVLVTQQASTELDLHEGKEVTALIKATVIHLIRGAGERIR
jgi:molybdate transport system ATP-binding protein